MKVILVDDEPIALEVLSSMLSKYEEVHIVASYTDPLIALEEIKETKPDVLFLDIEMGSINGLEKAQLFIERRSSIEIVFVTAYSEYAVGAFELNAVDYLLKPIQEKRLQKTIERLVYITNDSDFLETKENGLRINSFGIFEVMDSKGNQLVWRTQKAKELFIYLWQQNDKPVSKALIMETIFYDRDIDKATTLLHTTIYQLRKNLRELGYPEGILYFNDSYQINLPIVSDFNELNSILESHSYTEENIKKVLEIYIGDFLEVEGYHWAMGIQQNYKDFVLNLLGSYSKTQLEDGNLNLLVKICLDLLYELEPFNDNVAKMLIQYHGNKNEKSKLESFFNNYTENLWKEMNLKPMDSTLNLYEKYHHNTD